MPRKPKKEKETKADDNKVFCPECGCPHAIDAKCVSCREPWPGQE